MNCTVLATHRQFSLIKHKFYNMPLMYHYKPNIRESSFKFYYSSYKASRKGEREILTSSSLIPIHRKFQSTHEDGFIKRTLQKLKFKTIIAPELGKQSAILYTKIDEHIDTSKFFEVCQMPDTFYSWFRVKELHMWMLCVRCMASGQHGKVIRNELIKSFFLELDERSKKLEKVISSIRKRDVMELCHMFREDLVMYDGTLDGDDKKLASVLYSTLFQNQESVDASSLECCVNYVRRNLAHLDSISFGEILLNKNISFLPLFEAEQLALLK